MAEPTPKILVVDDQRGMRLTLSGVIEDKGYDVTGVEDGYQAIDAASKTTFDVIFMDIKMPGINGVQTFREIKKISPSSVVVMMTGFAVEDLVKEALAEGAFSVVYKPFDMDHVINLVESVLKTVVILVVDDRSGDRVTLMQVLSEKGYKVAGAEDGDEAIEMVKGGHFDVIFMDIKLPGKDGVVTFQEIRHLDPEAKVIFMTGFVLEESVKQAIEEYAYPVASKPLDIENVLGLVEQIVSDRTK